MCVGTPMKILAVEGLSARCVDEEGVEEVLDLALTGPLAPGTWVLGFLGAAREVMTEADAQKVSAALRGLRALMQGGELGPAFADLDDREPQLPPHLEAARRAGRSAA